MTHVDPRDHYSEGRSGSAPIEWGPVTPVPRERPGPGSRLPLPSERTVAAARERSQAALEEVRRVVTGLGRDLRDLEVYAREQGGNMDKAAPARVAYRDMADRIKAIRGES